MRKHYSDEQLLAHLDGELRGWTGNRLNGHLKACWLCRARQAELERQIQGLAEVFSLPGFPNPGWVKESKQRFREWREGWDAGPVPAEPHGWRRLFSPAAGISTAVVLLLAAIGMWWLTPVASPPSSVILGGAKRAEQELQRVAFHQLFRVEIAEHSSREARHTSRVEVWSEPGGSRFASRWEDHGELRYGIWRPGNQQEYVHNPRRSDSARAGISLPEAAESITDRQGLEEAFLRWLESRRWKPISIADEVATFVSQDGVAVRAERLPEGGLRVTAARKRRGITVELMMQVDEGNYRPRIQRMRLEGPEGAMELSLVAERIETFGAGAIESAVFVPAIPKQPVEAPATAEGSAEPAKPPAGAPSELAADETESVSREIEIYYALHRIRACLGEPVEVAAVGSGRFVIRGLAETAARRDEIQGVLLELPFVDFAVRTVDEAVSEAAPPAIAASTPPETARLSRPDPVLQEILVRHFRQMVPEAQIPARVVALSNEATLLSSTVVSDVWSLRRLEEKFPGERTAGLHGAVRWALEDMARDHRHAVGQGVSRLRGALAPLIPEGEDGGVETEREEFDRSPPERSERLFIASRRADGLVRSIFAGTPSQGEWDFRAALAELREAIDSLKTLAAAEGQDRSGTMGTARQGRKTK